MTEEIKVWHERDNKGNKTGRTIACEIEGTRAYVGISDSYISSTKREMHYAKPTDGSQRHSEVPDSVGYTVFFQEHKYKRALPKIIRTSIAKSRSALAKDICAGRKPHRKFSDMCFSTNVASLKDKFDFLPKDIESEVSEFDIRPEPQVEAVV